MCLRPGCDTEFDELWDEREALAFKCPSCGTFLTEAEARQEHEAQECARRDAAASDARLLGGQSIYINDPPTDQRISPPVQRYIYDSNGTAHLYWDAAWQVEWDKQWQAKWDEKWSLKRSS